MLAGELPDRGLVLEIASGSGEHAMAFARRFPALEWLPSDEDPEALASIAAWREDCGQDNLQPPVRIDTQSADWPVSAADAIVCINMVHISDWGATVGLFKGCAEVLIKQAPIILYGPYLEEGVETAASNLDFDQSLKARNPAWGLRHLHEVDRLAAQWGFARTSRYEMPANNLTLVYRRPSS